MPTKRVVDARIVNLKTDWRNSRNKIQGTREIDRFEQWHTSISSENIGKK